MESLRTAQRRQEKLRVARDRYSSLAAIEDHRKYREGAIQKEIDGKPEKAFWKSEQDFMQDYNHRNSQLHHELTSVCDETNEICSGIIARFISLVEKVVEKFTGEDLSLCEIWGVPACLSMRTHALRKMIRDLTPRTCCHKGHGNSPQSLLAGIVNITD